MLDILHDLASGSANDIPGFIAYAMRKLAWLFSLVAAIGTLVLLITR